MRWKAKGSDEIEINHRSVSMNGNYNVIKKN